MYIAPIDSLKRIINKYCYIFCLIPIGICVFLDFRFNIFEKFLQFGSNTSSLIDACGTFIGFLLTALTIFISLPKDSEYAKRFRKYGHDKIFAYSSVFSTLFFFIYIFLWFCSFDQLNIAFYIFLCGLAEMAVVFYYAFRMAIDSY